MAPDFSFPDEQRTGTPIDEYFALKNLRFCCPRYPLGRVGLIGKAAEGRS